MRIREMNVHRRNPSCELRVTRTSNKMSPWMACVRSRLCLQSVVILTYWLRRIVRSSGLN